MLKRILGTELPINVWWEKNDEKDKIFESNNSYLYFLFSGYGIMNIV